MKYRETIVTCDDCGAAQVAYVDGDGGVSVNGQSGCRRCGASEFAEHSAPTEEGR